MGKLVFLIFVEPLIVGTFIFVIPILFTTFLSKLVLLKFDKFKSPPVLLNSTLGGCISIFVDGILILGAFKSIFFDPDFNLTFLISGTLTSGPFISTFTFSFTSGTFIPGTLTLTLSFFTLILGALTSAFISGTLTSGPFISTFTFSFTSGTFIPGTLTLTLSFFTLILGALTSAFISGTLTSGPFISTFTFSFTSGTSRSRTI